MERWEEVLTLSKISLGDSRSYYISTARNDLGVLYATSETGNSTLIPYAPLGQFIFTSVLQVSLWKLIRGKPCAVRETGR